MSRKKKVLIGIVAALVIIQFIQIDHTKPEYDRSQSFEVIEQENDNMAIIVDACYDCHSYETEYPWYTYLQPVGWVIRGHIRGGRNKLNFSEWGTLSQSDREHKFHEMAEEIIEGVMPPKGFVGRHPEAVISEEDQTELIQWLRANSN
jgi:hypothetical protein